MDPCYLKTEKFSAQHFRGRKKRMTVISSQKIWFTAIWSTKKMDPSYLEVEKNDSQLFRARRTVSQLFGERRKGTLLF